MIDSSPVKLSSTLQYDPFGSVLEGRNWEAGSGYRYGFNGKEQDDEVDGNANYVDYGFRVYDPRLGRWFSVDLLNEKYPSLSPYTFVNNNPIINIDVNGKDFIIFIDDVNKTMTIRAVYYTETDRETKRATSAAMYLNGISGEYVFIDQLGNKYSINFQLSVVQTKEKGTTEFSNTTTAWDIRKTGDTYIINDAEEANRRKEEDQLGWANSFYEDPSVYYQRGSYGSASPGNNIRVVIPSQLPPGRSSGVLDVHEMFHTVGVSHKGLGGDQGFYIDKNLIGAILKSAGIKVTNVNSKNVLEGPNGKLFRGDSIVNANNKSSIDYKVIDKRSTLIFNDGGDISGEVKKNK